MFLLCFSGASRADVGGETLLYQQKRLPLVSATRIIFLLLQSGSIRLRVACRLTGGESAADGGFLYVVGVNVK